MLERKCVLFWREKRLLFVECRWGEERPLFQISVLAPRSVLVVEHSHDAFFVWNFLSVAIGIVES